mmetsp:Transcript_19798/g.35308  ORF Transcript_19798/g.35308 Transcript_19798/m.35308 type:complete len:212 (-) Transcript_19798:17-652(-)|eukprot:CAMPEP_0197529202 /NCGR_PEP_ID=MMETSP1318-20131121/27608_1 /TAXON_ID=552666 /ORGANISM="Partenskyella glossopodia, Strain RCC365" /LENGTH=211 /DNA_ID=CAMNT_0043084583 /DNA_START=54 /DNA_END=689 /DNA_ORIENTATION=-
MINSDSNLDQLRYTIRNRADEVCGTIDKIMMKIKETRVAGFLDRSFKTWDIYLEDFSQLSDQLQSLHEAVYQRDAFETLNALLIQPTGHYLPLPGGMREVMEQLRTKPIDEIEEDLKAIQTEAKKEASKPPQQDGKQHDTETLKQMTARLNEYNRVCDELEDSCKKMIDSMPKTARIPPQSNRSRNMIQPPPELQKMVDTVLLGDETRART